jgi:hypothetical protein
MSNSRPREVKPADLIVGNTYMYKPLLSNSPRYVRKYLGKVGSEVENMFGTPGHLVFEIVNLGGGTTYHQIDSRAFKFYEVPNIPVPAFVPAPAMGRNAPIAPSPAHPSRRNSTSKGGKRRRTQRHRKLTRRHRKH